MVRDTELWNPMDWNSPQMRNMRAKAVGDVMSFGVGRVASVASEVAGVSEKLQQRALSVLEKGYGRNVSISSLRKVHEIAKKAEQNIKFDTTVWPQLRRNIPRVTKGVIDESEIVGDALVDLAMAGPRAVAGVYKVGTYAQRAFANAVFPQPTSLTMKILREALFAGSAGAVGYGAYEGVEGFRQSRDRRDAEVSAAGAPAGAGAAYVNSQTNAVPAAISQDARVNREIIRRAYRDYDATTNKAAFAEALAPIMGDRDAVAAVEALNSAEYYAKTHRGQPLDRLTNGLGTIQDEATRARLQKVLDDHNAAFRALSPRERITGGY